VENGEITEKQTGEGGEVMIRRTLVDGNLKTVSSLPFILIKRKNKKQKLHIS
jgi:hypothetical protein